MCTLTFLIVAKMLVVGDPCGKKQKKNINLNHRKQCGDTVF
jgi:hypothetical protein